MKKQSSLIISLALLVPGVCLAQKVVDPTIAEPTEAVTPQQCAALNPAMSQELQKKVNHFKQNYESLLRKLLGKDMLPPSQLKTDEQRNDHKLHLYGIQPFNSDSNYVFPMPGSPDLIVKFVRPAIRVINSIKKVGQEGWLNTGKPEKEGYDWYYNNVSKDLTHEQWIAQYASKGLLAYMDEMIKNNPALNQTYQAASNLVAVKRIEQAKAEYVLDKIRAPQTHLSLFDEKGLPEDRNAFVIQVRVLGATLDQYVLNTPYNEQAAELIHQFYTLILSAKLWNAKGADVMVTADGAIVPVDVEKRDRYVQEALTAFESQHRVLCGIKGLIATLQKNPALFAVLEQLIAENPELLKILKADDEAKKLYPRLVEMGN